MKRSLAVAVMALVELSVLQPAAATWAAPYLGQKPPGVTPRIFAPGVVSTGNLHSRLAISPDGREMFWNTVDTTTFSTQLMTVREVGGRWTKPEAPSFATAGSTQSPRFSPDGDRLYFNTRAEQEWTAAFVERLASGWGAPRRDGVMLSSSSSFTRSGKVYLSSGMETKIWGTGIFSARLSADGITDAVPLDSVINVPHAIDYTPFVSPDESFLLFSSNRPVVGEKEDMHVLASFRSTDGTWSVPRRVSEIHARFPSLSPDGRYLFFCGDDGNMYWVDAKVIETLRPARSAGATRR